MMELNPTLNMLRKSLEVEPERNETSIKLLEILEMLIDRKEEDSLLIRDRLEDILKVRK
jgi:hypothetical protein